MNKYFSIAVLMTCFNRKEKTLKSIKNLFSSAKNAAVSIKIILVDDGSSDGTYDAVAACFPEVRLVKSKGNLYWCKGMSLAYDSVDYGNFDYVMWLNDDTFLYENAITSLLNVFCECVSPRIVVGATCDESGKINTYSGMRLISEYRKFSFDKVYPQNHPVKCDTLNGNIVLINRSASRIIGKIDNCFSHAMGDIDYGLRAKKLGVDMFVAPGFLGICENNDKKNTYHDNSLPIFKRLKIFFSRKGLPMRSWFILTKRHGGPFFFVYFLWPYIVNIFKFLVKK